MSDPGDDASERRRGELATRTVLAQCLNDLLDEAKVENSIGRNWLGGFDPPGRISNHFSLKLLIHESSQRVSLHRSVIHALRQPVPLSPDSQVRAPEELEKLERCILSVSQKTNWLTE